MAWLRAICQSQSVDLPRLAESALLCAASTACRILALFFLHTFLYLLIQLSDYLSLRGSHCWLTSLVTRSQFRVVQTARQESKGPCMQVGQLA